jgi:hypothetical protein
VQAHTAPYGPGCVMPFWRNKKERFLQNVRTYVRTYVCMYVYVCMFFVCVTYQWVFLYSLCTLNSVDIFAVIL